MGPKYTKVADFPEGSHGELDASGPSGWLEIEPQASSLLSAMLKEQLEARLLMYPIRGGLS